MSAVTNCQALGAHTDLACAQPKKLGGYSAVGILKPGQTTITDYTNATQISAAITNGDIRIVKNITGQYENPAPQQGANPIGCGPDQIPYTYSNKFKWDDYAVGAANDEFYDELKYTNGGLVVYNCNEKELQVYDGRVDYTVLYTGPQRQKEAQFYSTSAEWLARTFPVRYEGISNSVTALFEV